MKFYKVLFLLVLLFSFIIFSACGNADNGENGNDYFSEADTETETESETEIPITEDETIIVEDPPTTDPGPDIKPVQGNMIAGELSFIGADVFYEYEAKISGIYRFDFDINNVNYDYRFKLFSPKDEELINELYSCEDHGRSYDLVKGTKYIIQIIQENETPEYYIKIGVPETTKTIKENKFSGKLNYIDKKNSYLYTPTISGIYRFDFDISDVNDNYYFEIVGEKSERVADGYFNNDDNGVTCELKKGITYTIYVVQKTGQPNYKISIGVPKKVKSIDNGIFSGKLKYIGQVDRYTYSLSKGTYYLDFSNINADTELKVEIYSSKNKEILSTGQTDELIEFTISEKDTYNVFVKQSRGFTDYQIKIT